MSILVIALGVLTALYINKISKRDKKEGYLFGGIIIALFLLSCLPYSYNKVLPSYEKYSIPTCHVYVQSDVDVSDWKHIGLTSTYTTIREFALSDEEPIIVYNADELTAEEARLLYDETRRN